MCGAVFYTFCRAAVREFHYRRAFNACVETAVDVVHTCNRGANRFASSRHCHESCIGAERPDDACFDKPLFTSCARQDVLSSWWFFEGHTCVPWNFPAGGCPANGSAVFRTRQECTSRCAERGSRGPACQRPIAVSCTRRHLKYPFFAHFSSEDGRMRCLETSTDLLRDHRCLTGANRFSSRKACFATCSNSAFN
ncbi:uncharacterized protein LOC144152085 [Haemaphysalis longicornis]